MFVLKSLKRTPSKVSKVKVGDGAPTYSNKLLHQLDEALPPEIVIKSVSEAGTNRFTNETANRRGQKDVIAAIEIAGRKGRIFHRRKQNETYC